MLSWGYACSFIEKCVYKLMQESLFKGFVSFLAFTFFSSNKTVLSDGSPGD
jgi:hypothetical protein